MEHDVEAVHVRVAQLHVVLVLNPVADRVAPHANRVCPELRTDVSSMMCSGNVEMETRPFGTTSLDQMDAVNVAA